jgi:enoyl-CoA hydratase/carnithine racemase
MMRSGQREGTLTAMAINTTTCGGVATIQIARPQKKNALTFAMYEAMTAAIASAVADDAVRALLIVGEPGIFTAGNDLQDFMQQPPTGVESPQIRFMLALAACDKPVVAAVTGAAIGVGTTMLLHCDLVYVSEDAQLSMPFINLGLVPEFASSLILPRLLGHAKAAEKLLLGEPLSAAEAADFGIASAVLPAHEVLAHARRMAERFNSLPPGAVRDTKRLMRCGSKDSIVRAIHAEAEVFAERLRSPEAKEAFEAFFAKRKPDFSKL